MSDAMKAKLRREYYGLGGSPNKVRSVVELIVEHTGRGWVGDPFCVNIRQMCL